MRTRSIGILLAAGAAFALACPAGYAQARRPRLRSCAPRFDSSVLLSNRHAQVYEKDGYVYGCLRHGGRATLLAHAPQAGNGCMENQEQCGEASEETMTGTVVAYVESRQLWQGGELPPQIVARSIASGKLLHAASLSVAVSRETMLEWALPLQLAVAANGAVAWVQEDSFARHGGAVAPPTEFDVYAIDGDGAHTLSADLPSRPGSFEVVGKTFSWTQEGVHRSALLD
jgi:hypothetical protein